MESSVESSAEIPMRRKERSRINFGHRLLMVSLDIKDSNKRTVKSINNSVSKEPGEHLSSDKNPVKRKTEKDDVESEKAGSSNISHNSIMCSNKPYLSCDKNPVKRKTEKDNVESEKAGSSNVSHNSRMHSNKPYMFCDKNPVKRKTEKDYVESEKACSSNISHNSKIYNLPYMKSRSDSNYFSSDNENNVVPRYENKSFNAKHYVKRKHFDTFSKNVIHTQDKGSKDYIEFEKIGHSHRILTVDKNIKISLKNDIPRSTPITCFSNNLAACNISCDLETNHSYLDIEKEKILSSAEENYIPPPVVCEVINDSIGAYDTQGSSSPISEKNETLIQLNDNLESAENLSNSEDEIYSFCPGVQQIEAITKFILAIVKEKSVPNSLADQVEHDLNAIVREQLEGNRIEVYGSYFSDLAISTSDINLALISDGPVRKQFMYEVYKLLSEELKKLYFMYPYEESNSVHHIKINFAHIDTGITCQLAYLGRRRDDMRKMGRFLRKVSKIDERIKTLIIAAKIWSECVNINEVDDGKLHPVGYTLMVLHFLQHCERPILSNFPCEKADVELLTPNDSLIGELWLAFLKYYSITFNWKQDVITIDSKEYVSKKSKGWENYWIAVEDPFTGKNIGESVINSDVADYIKACFKSSYEYFCNSDQMLNSADDEDESVGDSLNSTWLFSFQQCIADQTDAFCEECEDSAGTCEECQKKMYVQPMLPLPKMTDSFLKMLNKSLMAIYEKYILPEDEINERKMFVQKLQANVRRIFPDAELILFGSSANGFGFKNSDLDICISLQSKKVNVGSVLKALRSLLRKDKNFDYVIAIFNATIPIVKFRYQPKGWQGDISLFNPLAIHNTNLLHTYSLLDERCKILGCAFKLLAKKALIAEVTEKALSSYSYINMVIYFLQQIEPPVLPVLQDYKFRKNDFKLDHIVENCNVWFCDDLEYIKSVFKAENKTSVEQLWLELLDYYCSYDYNKFISIRQKAPEYLHENKHCARLFNIQDPFLITKNLGCVVSAKKAQETKSVLSRARQLFRTPVKELPTYVKDIEDFFFSTQSLTGRIHKEVHCDICGKFGHDEKECKHSQFYFQRFNIRRFPRYYKGPIKRTPYRTVLPKNR